MLTKNFLKVNVYTFIFSSASGEIINTHTRYLTHEQREMNIAKNSSKKYHYHTLLRVL